MNNLSAFQKSIFLFFLLLFSAFTYYELTYQTSRENFLQIISLLTLLFAAYFVIYRFYATTHFTSLVIAGLFFRMLLLFSIPHLSDDVYRFIWDGRLAANGINPFGYLPSEVLKMNPVTGITKELFIQLNSPNYFTIYPPVLQAIFWVTAKLVPENVFGAILCMKSFIVMIEITSFFLIIQLLQKCSLPKTLSFLYFLNPLVITELSGNVHFEGVMIYFVLLAFLFVLENRWQFSAIFLGLGIATKLVPVLFIPLLFNKLGWKKGMMYTLITLVTVLVLFSLVIDLATIQHLLTSANLFISHFEFNASIYYVVRWVGAKITGYNIIAYAGPVLVLFASSLIFYLSLRHTIKSPERLMSKALLTITIWYLCATTVHPWYICLPVLLAVFTPYHYPFIWSFTAILSYAAYQLNPVHENLWLIGTGYMVMIGYAFWEIKSVEEKTILTK